MNNIKKKKAETLTIKSGKKGPHIKKGIIETNVKLTKVELESFILSTKHILSINYFSIIQYAILYK